MRVGSVRMGAQICQQKTTLFVFDMCKNVGRIPPRVRVMRICSENMAGYYRRFVIVGASLALAMIYPLYGRLGPPGGYQYLYAMATAILYLWVIDMDMKPTRRGRQKKTPTGVPKGHETNV